MAGNRKDIEAVVTDAVGRGWVVVRRGRHVVLRHPRTGVQVTVPSSPGSGKAVIAARCQLRRGEL